RLEAADLAGELDHPGITLSGPVDYDTLLATLGRSQLVVTDSGGIQEEAAWLGVPVIVLRSSTPRWEGVEAGTTTLAGLADDVAAAAAAAGLDGAAVHAALSAQLAAGSDAGGTIDRALLAVGVPAADLPALVPPLVAVFTRHEPAELPTYPGVPAALRALADA